jgi:uncharacterized membrane protein
MKEINLSTDAVKILEDYFDRLKSKLKNLPRSERQEILNEIRSDILTELDIKKEEKITDVDILFSILKKLGRPEEVADEILSKKLISFRGNFLKRFFIFTGRNLIGALARFMLSILLLLFYFFGFLNIAMAFLKVFIPDKIGLFILKGEFAGYGFKFGSFDIGIGTRTNICAEEILGFWIIPLGIFVGFFLIIAINYLDLKTRKVLRFLRADQ